MADSVNFEKLALPHLDAVYRAAVALCGQRDVADDLVQATFAKALAGFGSYQEGTDCRAWLLQILRNTWRDELRHRRVVGHVLPIDELAVPAKEESEEPVWTDSRAVLESFSDEQVIAALMTLPEEQRLALFLADVLQIEQDEAARIMDVAVGTIKSRTSRARRVLRKVLKDHARDMGIVGRRP
jgi:RNA polymerase sigma-70 factor (ECF subfamily)